MLLQPQPGRRDPLLQPAFSVERALDRRVTAEFSEREPDGYWHPSSLFGCLRQAIYADRGTPITDPRDARSRRVLRVGHVMHDYVQGAIEADPSVVAAFREVKLLDPEHRIKGSTDEIIFVWVADGNPPDGPLEVSRLLGYVAAGYVRVELLELKTINSVAFKYKDLPKADHAGQVATYLHVLLRHGATTEGGVVIPPTQARARIAYVSKDDLLVSEHTIFLTPGKEREIVTRAGTLDRYHSDGVALPPRLEAGKGGKRHFLCGYCPYQARCYEQDGAGVDLREDEGLGSARRDD